MRDTFDKILHDLITDHAALGRLRVFEENAPKVLQALKKGDIDCVDGTAWSFPDFFFAFLVGPSEFLPWAASTFPTPRKRHLVPIWLELCCAIHMALSEEPAFRGLEHLLKAGPILTRVKFNLGGCEGGFNYRNTHPRQTVLCPDTVRKYFRATQPESLTNWYHGPVLNWFRRKRGFAKSRVFALDSTYIVVPENERYGHTARLPLDEHHRFIDTSGLSEEQKKRVRHVPCYKLTYLLHLGEEPSGRPEPHPYFLIPAFRFGPGDDDSHEHGRWIADTVTKAGGKGWMKWLIADRGFLDGQWIEELKLKHGTNLVIPLRKNMEAYEDVVGLARLPDSDVRWETVRQEHDEHGHVQMLEQVTSFSEVRSWKQCRLPLYVALIRKQWRNLDGEWQEDHWAITSPEPFSSGHMLIDFYHHRSRIEEVNRALKQPRRLDRFTSPQYSLVVAHIVFTLLTYSLIEFFLKARGNWDLTHRFLRTLRQERTLGREAVILY
ncbi:MAG: transposase, partial [Planctomycetes bacterium]|nr:transposase [Planctomycetota bacterium]